VGYWHRMIYIYMKKKTKFTDRLQFTKGGCFVVKKDIFYFVDGLLKEDVIMLNLYPDLKQEEMDDTKREFIFVIDRSGKLYLLLTSTIILKEYYICIKFNCNIRWFYPYVLLIDMAAMMVHRQGHRTYLLIGTPLGWFRPCLV
jgi:hypothetical protein